MMKPPFAVEVKRLTNGPIHLTNILDIQDGAGDTILFQKESKNILINKLTIDHIIITEQTHD